MIKPLFFLGMVRSGTSFAGRILTTQNSDVYITHESDIIWILYNLYHLRTSLDNIKKYKWDSPQAMENTLKTCRDLLLHWKKYTPSELYEKCQQRLMNRGTNWQKIIRRKTIYLGDKKPTQQSDPIIFNWTEKIFKEYEKPKYIHLLRHPNDFLGSTLNFRKTATLWGEDKETILKFWVKTQQNVIELKKQIPDRVITIKYEDLCNESEKFLEKIYKFLNVSLKSIASREKIEKIKQPTLHEEIKLDFDLPDGFEILLEEFGYEMR